MPDEATGPPSFDDEGPDDRDHGAENVFDAVVLDEDFIRAAVVHEPTAAERHRAAARARAEAEAAASREEARGHGGPEGGHGGPEGHPDDADDDGFSSRYPSYDYLDSEDDDPFDDDAVRAHPNPHYAEWAAGRSARHRAPVRWYRPVAWVLAVLMGVGAVAMALTAAQRGAPAQREEPRNPPASTEPDGLGAPAPHPQAPAGAAAAF
ncbi:SCO2584 family spore wall biosynthesis protein [Streptomyces sp. GSL17-111]|uniref:SCO2584 family spore wall biosynthesis protein n=1 Tax=Streptomyces sp. GSL17-111 TaxID=3121596 RepID=UPI0030F4093E